MVRPPADSVDVTAEALPDDVSDTEGSGSGVDTYDFRNPSKFSREHSRMLDQIFETYGKQCATVLTTTLRSVCTHDLKSVQQTTYGAYIASLPQTTTMFLLDLAPLKVTSIVEFSPQAAMLMIQYMLGGQGEDNQPERGLTEIETTLLSSMVDRMLGELKYVMAPVLPLQPRIMATESSPQFAQVSPPSDQVVVVHFDMDINEIITPATLCLPFKELLPHLDRAVANARTRRDDADSIAIARAVETRVRMAPIEVAVRMGPTNIRMLEIATMEVGDVIKLRHPVNIPLEVIGSDLVYGYAVPGSDGQRAACLIVNPNEEQ